MNKIIFVNFYTPIIKRFPLGIAYLISTIKKKTHYIPILFDENIYREKKKPGQCIKSFDDLIIKQKPDYVAFTLSQNEINNFLKYARLIKSKFPLCRIIVGGVQSTVLGKNLIKNIKEIDILVRKEGELIIAEILNGKKLENIPNIVFRKKNKLVQTKELKNYNLDIDNIPWPSRKLFDMELYSNSPMLQYMMLPTATMLLSRGCTGDCAFCVSQEVYEEFRVRDPKDAIREVCDIITKYPYIRYIYFTDNCFHLKHPKVKEFLRSYNKLGLHKKLTFGIQTRVDYIDEETVGLLKKSRCSFVSIGIESFSLKIQKSIGKIFSLKDFEKKNIILKKSGMFVAYSLIFNYPGMDYADVKYNIKTIEENKLKNVGIVYLNPIPGTRIFKELVSNKILPSLDYEKINWHADFINDFQKKRFWNLTRKQEEDTIKYIKKKTKYRFWYWFFRLTPKQKLKYVYLKTRFNPVLMAKSFAKNI